MGSVNAGPAEQLDQATTGGRESVSYLRSAHWSALNTETNPERFARSWIGVLSGYVSDLRQAVVFGRDDETAAVEVARLRAQETLDPSLQVAAERAMGERRGIVLGSENGFAVAHPFVIAGEVRGAAAMEIASCSKEALVEAAQHLRWGAAWIEVFHLRARARDDDHFRVRTSAFLDLSGSIIDEKRFQAVALSVVSELARRFGCTRVSYGRMRGAHIRLEAISHSTRFKRGLKVVRSIGAAMEEAVDQRELIVWPPIDPDSLALATNAERLARAGDSAGSVLTVPFTRHGADAGAFTFERAEGEPFDHTIATVLDGLCASLGPMLEAKRIEDRPLFLKGIAAAGSGCAHLLGPGHLTSKAAVLAAAAVVAILAFVSWPMRVSATAALEGTVQRVVAAPFQAYISKEMARPGDKVSAGQVLATLADEELRLKRLRSVSQRAQASARRDRALAERKAAEVNVLSAEMEQSTAEIALLDEQIEQSRLRAPFAGLVVSGDLRQAVGSAVERGKTLFEIAPLESYRVVLQVDEGDVALIYAGQSGSVLLSSLPNQDFPVSIARITPVAEVVEGHNTFRVEASLDAGSDQLRPGMKGVAKVTVGERPLGIVLGRKFVDWARIQAWSWWP